MTSHVYALAMGVPEFIKNDKVQLGKHNIVVLVKNNST